MERTYRFLFNDWNEEDDDNFDFRELGKLFPNREEIHAEYKHKKYYGLEIVKVTSKKMRQWKDYDGSDILLTDYKFKVYSYEDRNYMGVHGDTFEDDEDPCWEIGTELERVYYRGHAVYAPFGTNLIEETETSFRGGTVVTAPLSAIIDFLKARKGCFLTISDTQNEDLKKYFDFEIGSCSSIEY